MRVLCFWVSVSPRLAPSRVGAGYRVPARGEPCPEGADAHHRVRFSDDERRRLAVRGPARCGRKHSPDDFLALDDVKFEAVVFLNCLFPLLSVGAAHTLADVTKRCVLRSGKFSLAVFASAETFFNVGVIEAASPLPGPAWARQVLASRLWISELTGVLIRLAINLRPDSVGRASRSSRRRQVIAQRVPRLHGGPLASVVGFVRRRPFR